MEIGVEETGQLGYARVHAKGCNPSGLVLLRLLLYYGESHLNYVRETVDIELCMGKLYERSKD